MFKAGAGQDHAVGEGDGEADLFPGGAFLHPAGG